MMGENNNMDVTVIITSFNEKEYIEKTIQSVIDQEFQGTLQIIIGDDGSNDGTIEIIYRYQKKYPNIISSFVMDRADVESTSTIIPSVRVSKVLKRGISMAKGKYICFLAGDDFYSNRRFISSHFDMLNNSMNKKYIGCYCYFDYYWNDNEREQSKWRSDEKRHLSFSMYWGGQMYIHVSAFMYRNIFHKIDISSINFIDDIGMEFIMGQFGDFCCIPESMFCYRQREKSIMRTNSLLDNSLCTLLLYADCRTSGFRKYRIASYSRLIGSTIRLYKSRLELLSTKYDKYFSLYCGAPSKVLNHWVIRGNGSIVRRVLLLCSISFLYFCYLPYRIVVKKRRV